MLALAAENLVQRYGGLMALDGLSLQVPAGALFGLLGPNGSGKSTLFRIISTLLRPVSGTCMVFGADVQKEAKIVRQKLGVVFQQPALDESLSIEDNLWLHGTLYGLKGANLKAQLEKRLMQFGLADRAKSRCKHLSGGLLRRADLARGLLHAPQLLLLDEPTNGLDPIARHEFWQLVEALRKVENITVLVATHLMEEAERCTEVAVMYQGKCVVQGAPDALRDEMGQRTLWIEMENPVEGCAEIGQKLKVSASLHGSQIQVSHASPETLLAPLYQTFGTRILSATLRRPTLEDVFMIHTGVQYS